MTDKQIAYEPHPVSPARKAELIAAGFRIIDAVYAPKDVMVHANLRDDGPTVAEFVAAGYRAANYPPSGYASRSTPEEIAEAITAQAGTLAPAAVSGDQMSDDELRAALTAAGKPPHPQTGRKKLIAQYLALKAAQ